MTILDYLTHEPPAELVARYAESEYVGDPHHMVGGILTLTDELHEHLDTDDLHGVDHDRVEYLVQRVAARCVAWLGAQ